jgi:hypothetical protein
MLLPRCRELNRKTQQAIESQMLLIVYPRKQTPQAGAARERKLSVNCCTVVWHAWMHAVLWVDSADNFHVISHVYRMGEDAKVCTQGHDGAVRRCTLLSASIFQLCYSNSAHNNRVDAGVQ